MSTFDRAVAVLQVGEVKRSIDFYAKVLGFRASLTFPKQPPYAFAILERDTAEIMLQRSKEPPSTEPVVARPGWSLYLRVLGGQLLDLHEAAQQQTIIHRLPERMPYGDVEFEVVDPDGHLICVSEQLPETAKVRKAKEE